MSEALHTLVAVAARAVPGLDGRVAAASMPPWHADLRLAELHRTLSAAHAEAGPQYAALRGWGLLVWQPAYLVVLAAHLGEVQLDLDRVSLRLAQGQVEGYAVAPHPLRQGDEQARLEHGARQLGEGLSRLLPAWQRQAPLNARSARRTCAECVLAALLVARNLRQWTADHARRQGEAWLDLLDLRGEAGYLGYRDLRGAEALATDRKVCCLHFRRHDGARCSTCPKHAPHERVRRQLAEEAAA
jgi:siderophore ferric iron reductase